jgi:3-methyladenine DNA glycosylase AlkC
VAKLLKESFDKSYIELLSLYIKDNYSEFDIKSFVDDVFYNDWDALELKQRVRHISTNLHKHIDKSYKESIDILKDVASKLGLDYYLQNLIFSDFVEVYGLGEYDHSIDALKHFTKFSTAEFAIREFIKKDEDKTMQILQTWSSDECEHVRRLASEGCRPRLPWSSSLNHFKKDPSKILPILELLKNDRSKYVQKSVANNLNDISKDNPEIFKRVVFSWYGVDKNTDWIVKHACRTLLKSGDKDVLKLFGYESVKHLKVNNFEVSNSLKIGEDFEFSFELSSCEQLGKVRVEYVMYYLRKGNNYSKKVFKIAEFESLESFRDFRKKHSFKILTTRKYYAGVHKISIVVNGVLLQIKEFELIK